MTELQKQNSLKTGKLFIIFGPSGVGKTTIAQALIARMEKDHRGKLVMVRSYTTRNPRPNERQGVDYWFISQQEFESKKDQNFFLEYSTVYKASYGSSYQEIIELLANGCSVLVVIDRYGAEQILQRIPNAVIIQIVPPKIETLRERLIHRSDISEKDIEFRMEISRKELLEEQCSPLAHYSIVNDDLEKTTGAMYGIIIDQIYS